MNLTKNDIKQIGFTGDSIFLETNQGIKQSMPLSWFVRLKNATKEQRENFTLSPFGIHWEELDEDLSFDGFFTYNKEDIDNNKNEIQIILSELSFVNFDALGNITNISLDLIRHYAFGIKIPSPEHTQDIKNALHKMGNQILELV